MSAPSPWVERFLSALPVGGHVLDLACGAGRHVALARQLGFRVTGVDRDIGAARAGFAGDSGVRWIEHDLETGAPLPFGGNAYDVVIVTNYLWRPILPDVVSAVVPAGALIYETFRVGNEVFGKPSNPDFLLRPGELLEAVREKLYVIAFEEVRLEGPPRLMQRICAVGRDHLWFDAPPRL